MKPGVIVQASSGLFLYLWRIVKFAIAGRLPRTVDEVPIWAICVPFRQWNEPWRYTGKTFKDSYTGRFGPVARALIPFRLFYLLFLLCWPLVAAGRGLRRGRRGYRHYRGCLARPALALEHPRATYTEREWRWTRADFPLGMFFAWETANTEADHLRLEDKRHFEALAQRLGLPLAESLSVTEAKRRGGLVVVKDPHRDLGYGIVTIEAEALPELSADEEEEVIIQPKLNNHADLLVAFPEEAPLSTLRVTTTLHPETLEPEISRCAVRMGKLGAPSDNTAQGGIWANVDLETGRMLAGVTKKSFGTWKEGAPAREGRHPNTGRSFVGVRVPWWEEGRVMALDAHRRLAPEALSLGWDIALAEDAPVFLEVNVWTVVYDYDPPSDACAPACELILARLHQRPRI